MFTLLFPCVGRLGITVAFWCTSYSLKPTTIPLAPPLVEVNGEVLKTLADRTAPFFARMADPCIAPGDISHTYRGLSPFRGGLGGHSKLAPLFKGSLSETATVTTMRFKTGLCTTYRNYSSYKNTFDVFVTKREYR